MSAMVIGPDLVGAARGVRRERENARPRRLSAAPASARGAAPAPSLPLRLTRRGRVVVSLLALALSGGAFLLGSYAAAGATEEPVVDTYVVRSGDTLWDIAAASRAEGESVQEQVRELVRLNGMSGAHVDAGQTLLVPRG